MNILSSCYKILYSIQQYACGHVHAYIKKNYIKKRQQSLNSKILYVHIHKRKNMLTHRQRHTCMHVFKWMYLLHRYMSASYMCTHTYMDTSCICAGISRQW